MTTNCQQMIVSWSCEKIVGIKSVVTGCHNREHDAHIHLFIKYAATYEVKPELILTLAKKMLALTFYNISEANNE